MSERLVLGLVLATFPGLGGCSKKVPECNSLVEVVNPAVESMNRVPLTGSSSVLASASKELAGMAEEAGQKLASVKLTLPELQEFSTKYQQTSQDLAKAAREHAARLQAVDVARQQAQKAVALAQGDLKAVEAACAKGGDWVGCKAITTALPSAPSDWTKMADVQRFIEQLAKLTSRDPAVKAALDKASATLKQLTQITADADVAAKTVQEAERARAEADAREDKIVSSFNAFCSAS